MSKEKLEDWEYMLKSSIYIALIGYQDSNGHSIPCLTRTQMEAKILSSFKSKLNKDDLIITSKSLPNNHLNEKQ